MIYMAGIRVRRAIKKQKGQEISVPVPPSNEKVKAEVKKRIEDGTYNLGVAVAPTEVIKLAVNVDGEVEKMRLELEARKIPLFDIRRDAMTSNKDFLRLKDDGYYDQLPINQVIEQLNKINEEPSENPEEMRMRLRRFQRQRHWLLWHDHSTLANYGHMLFCLREMYDPAIHLSKAEATKMFGREIDVQATVERPHLYILGQSRSTIEDQMRFVPTRQDDLRALNTPIMADSGEEVQDIMRFMNPAVEMEDGTQHGGNYGCVGCDGSINSTHDLGYALQRKYRTLTEKKDHVLAGPAGRKGGLHPFKNLKVEDLRKELRARGIPANGRREELQRTLSEELGGTVRIPALLHGEGDVTVEELNLQSYEVLCFEALHCTMNHIKNVLQELPHHITDIDTLIKLKELLQIQLSKEKLRGVDYRKTLIVITTALYTHLNRSFKALLLTLCEIIQICYMQDELRSPKVVLRLHNLCWQHAVLCRKLLTPPKALTYRKLFGLYFHSIVVHAPFLLRMVSHRSTNAEMFERLFEKLTDITSKTWSKRIEDLCSNAILHYQAEKARGESKVMKEEREITKIARSLPKLGNTVLTKQDLHQYADDWAAHMELIADFLKPGKGVWWCEVEGECIEFYDGPDEVEFREQGPRLHHFRSTSIKGEQQYLANCWNNCITEEVQLPAVRMRDPDGRWHVPPMCCPDLPQEPMDIMVASTEVSVDGGENVGEDGEEDGEEAGGKDGGEPENCQMPDPLQSEEMAMEDLSPDSGEEPEEIAFKEAPMPKHVPTTYLPVDDGQPAAKKPRQDESTAITSKTGQALRSVLGPCPEVAKFEKLKCCLAKNPRSRYHIDLYETHLAHIQILILKAYRQLHNEINAWKATFQNSRLREATDSEMKGNQNVSKLLSTFKIASRLLAVWKITVHLP